MAHLAVATTRSPKLPPTLLARILAAVAEAAPAATRMILCAIPSPAPVKSSHLKYSLATPAAAASPTTPKTIAAESGAELRGVSTPVKEARLITLDRHRHEIRNEN